MKAGSVPYWHCGGEVLTRGLDLNGRIGARALGVEDARRLAGFYGDDVEGRALNTALEAAAAWARASQRP